MEVVILAAGRGTRFKDYTTPKPFVHYGGKPMLQHSIDMFPDYDKTVILREDYGQLADRLYGPKLKVKFLSAVTEGAAITLGAADLPLGCPFVSVDCDLVVAGAQDLVRRMARRNAIAVVDAPEDTALGSWSFVERSGVYAKFIAEKKPISRTFCIGIYGFKDFGSYLQGLARMVIKNDRTNGEFYLAPVYNYLQSRARLYNVAPELYRSFGTPEAFTPDSTNGKVH